ncbi:MAG TPA: DUF222 domain-containing protein [Acidimicrobiales bacterium]|nr:DUF222 domain-containing protein [Acidimicrobiales bacterium]
MSTSVSEQGRELIAAWTEIERGKARWVMKLAEFDASGAWREDGHATCMSWIVDRCEVSRTSAKDKLRIAHELTRRHMLRAAFIDGLAYSKVRALVRLDGLDHERDATFVEHAKRDSVRVLEDRVRNWNYYNGQDKKPTSLDDHYGIVRQRGFSGGLGRVVIEAPDDMLDRMFAIVDAYGDHLFHAANGVGEDTLCPRPQAVDNSDGEHRRAPGAQRLDWLFDLVEERALADPRAIDPYKATVGVTIQYEDLINASGPGLSSQGTWLTGEAVRRLCCDAGIHRIVVKGESEILDFGREERLYNRVLRRAIRFRHAHMCAVRGCGRRITQIHHIHWWEEGGETSIDNGLPLCSFHHHLVHEGGWTVAWNASTGVTRLEGPKGQILETTTTFRRAA